MYCNPFYDHAGYGNVFSVDESGAMKENIQNYEYCEKTAIHGMVFDPTETYLYSADMWANRVWCHKKIDDQGRMETVGYTEATQPKDHPRWVEMHPSGQYLYALMEGGNRLCEYVIDPQTKLPIYTHKTYPLIPPGTFNPSSLLSSIANNTRHPQPRHHVPLRRLLPQQVRHHPLRNLALQLVRPHRLHRRLQNRTIRRNRAPALPKPHTDVWRALERRVAVPVER